VNHYLCLSLIPLLVSFFPEEFIGQTRDDYEIKKIGKSLSKIYTKEEHLSHETMSSGVQANDGRMYFANNQSLMQFDGQEWKNSEPKASPFFKP
jgi:hypothetical protein